METYEVKLKIRAECEADARELLEDYSGRETDLRIVSVKRVADD